jgi:hypothetical protein
MAWTRWSEIGYAARLVTANAVAPSLIETDMMKGQDNLVSRAIPLGAPGKAEEVAIAVMILIDYGISTEGTDRVDVFGGVDCSVSPTWVSAQRVRTSELSPREMRASTISFHFKRLYRSRSRSVCSQQEPKTNRSRRRYPTSHLSFESRNDSAETILNPKLLLR